MARLTVAEIGAPLRAQYADQAALLLALNTKQPGQPGAALEAWRHAVNQVNRRLADIQAAISQQQSEIEAE